MPKQSKPVVKRGPTSRYAANNETILEVSSPNDGALMSFRTMDDEADSKVEALTSFKKTERYA